LPAFLGLGQELAWPFDRHVETFQFGGIWLCPIDVLAVSVMRAANDPV
jgi:hypothetical protein